MSTTLETDSSISLCDKLKSHKHQSLRTHLNGVVDIASVIFNLQFDDPELCEVIRKVCLAHDFAKATTFFQKYLNDKSFKCSESNHALLSALFAYWWLPEEYKRIGFLVVKRHHGYLRNVRHEFSIGDKYTVLRTQIDDIKKHSQNELESIYGIKLDDFFSFVTKDNLFLLEDLFTDRFSEGFSVSDNFKFSYIYSLLRMSDVLQVIDEQPVSPSHKDCKIVEARKNYVRNELLRKKPAIAHSRIFKVREDILDNMKLELDKVDILAESFFRINVPTGSGKTYLAYYASMYLSDKFEYIYGKPARIIYALPFISVIDQVFDELIQIMNHGKPKNSVVESNVAMKYHSMAEIKDVNENELYNPDVQFLYDNWQSSIIVTTFVQLMNTIFKIGDKKLSPRFHCLVNSIIVLDEIQSLDGEYYLAMCDIFKVLAKEYNMKFIFVTATMPELIEARDLVKDCHEYFIGLNRVVIHNHLDEDISLDEFARNAVEDINKRQDKSFLFVLNTKKSARALFDYIEKNTQRKKLYLSTDLYPRKRLEKIEYARDTNDKLVIVSTQLIEAGVDIDIDVVYRDFAPLISLIQTAGRAGRNGIGVDKGEVHLYKLKNEKGRYYCDFIYPKFTLFLTAEILEKYGDVIGEDDIYSLNREYAEKIKGRTSSDKSRKFLKYFNQFDALDLCNSFKLINDKYAFKKDIYINADNECAKLIADLESMKGDFENKWKHKARINSIFRKLNQYKVSLYMSDYDAIKGMLSSIQSFDVEYLPLKVDGKTVYDEDKGIVVEIIDLNNTSDE